MITFRAYWPVAALDVVRLLAKLGVDEDGGVEPVNSVATARKSS